MYTTNMNLTLKLWPALPVTAVCVQPKWRHRIDDEYHFSCSGRIIVWCSSVCVCVYGLNQNTYFVLRHF